MKRFLITIIIIGICGYLVYTYYLPTLKKKVEIDDVTAFEFVYTTGYGSDNYASYAIECSSSGCIAKVKPNNTSEINAVIVDVDDNFLAKVRFIIEENDVAEWNGYNKVNRHILDGNSFDLKVKMKNDQIIKAHGYMNWPLNYSKVAGEFDTLFMSLVKR